MSDTKPYTVELDIWAELNQYDAENPITISAAPSRYKWLFEDTQILLLEKQPVTIQIPREVSLASVTAKAVELLRAEQEKIRENAQAKISQVEEKIRQLCSLPAPEAFVILKDDGEEIPF